MILLGRELCVLVVLLVNLRLASAKHSSYQWQDSLLATTSSSWQAYIRSPATRTVSPASIVANLTLGNVTNPDGLLTSGGQPTTLTRLNASDTAPTIVVDFGQNVVGFLSVAFAGASNNTPGVRLAFSETLEYLTDVSDFTRSYNGDSITPGTDQFAVPSGPYTWLDDHGCLHGTQVCADGLHGFRYLKIYLDALAADAPYTSAYGQVEIDSLSLNFTAFLGTPDTFTGWFESSDNQLNQFWYDAVYTNDMCIDTFRVNDTDPRGAGSASLVGKLVAYDGAKRDRDPYVGDLGVAARTIYLSHDVAIAARDVLADLGDHQRADGWIPPASINDYTLALFDYPLWWVVCGYDLYMYTGDDSYIQSYYDNIALVLDSYYPSTIDPATGLVTKGLGTSSGYGDYAFLPRTGPVTYYNALYVQALDNAASIATFIGGHEGDAARWTARARNISAAINTYLFDNSTGAYFDTLPGISHAQDGNSISITSGVASRAQAKSVLAYLAENNARFYGNAFYDNDATGSGFSQRVYAFISFFELEARFLTGLAGTALEEIRRLYGWMASNDPGITFWEGIGANGSKYEADYTSLAHGWSTGVVPALTNYVLGVIPTGPAFSVWSVKPIPGDVTWARGQVPTPNGAISVDWTSANNYQKFRLAVSAPTASTGVMSVPVVDNSTSVYIDGQVAWSAMNAFMDNATYADGYVSVTVSGGDHVITVG
ncbi:six-hairpin glycosidase-3 [Coleophoma crateriformis]|uniref:Six-hairpin glycosidase-3 n=1 Tax=Coleophoma crateriformis TaxID=565419 RepID=A0A3D8S3C3_9HELO|nr:six-hairpin glycosidase-3 [Coleophoma crateriformis]